MLTQLEKIIDEFCNIVFEHARKLPHPPVDGIVVVTCLADARGVSELQGRLLQAISTHALRAAVDKPELASNREALETEVRARVRNQVLNETGVEILTIIAEAMGVADKEEAAPYAYIENEPYGAEENEPYGYQKNGRMKNKECT